MSSDVQHKFKPKIFSVKQEEPTPEDESRIEKDEKSTKPVLKDALARIKAQMAHLPKPKME